VIILNCPSCRLPIMYFRRKIFHLDQRQLKKITGSSPASLVSRLLEQLATAETAARYVTKKNAFLYHGNTCVALRHNLTLEQREEKYITGDDCTNLRIELELCTDSKAFINRL